MPIFNADLHIHSPHSIAVSQNLSLPTMWNTAQKKGLELLATGDITQPTWRNYLKEKLIKKEDIYYYRDLAFILGTELEDEESVHHVVFLPDFHAAEELQKSLDPFVKNITGKWAGRPHVNKSPAELVDFIEEVGGICGPAHAFTPFKSIFRQGKFETLAEAYQDNVKKVAFLELGLSADTELADRLECLQNVTFLSNSDAHSEGPQSLGREFNRLEIEAPNFNNVRAAVLRKKGARVILNVGLDPHLGKYYIMFCRKCRRRVIASVEQDIQEGTAMFGFPTPIITENFLKYSFSSQKAYQDFLTQVSRKQIECTACKHRKLQKYRAKGKRGRKPTIPKLKLGVSERINQIASWDNPHHPDHRPPYLDIVPLVEMIRKILGIKNPTSKRVMRTYDQLIEQFGSEYDILIDLPPKTFQNILKGKLSSLIRAFRTQTSQYIPGGGGTFGEIKIDGEF